VGITFYTHERRGTGKQRNGYGVQADTNRFSGWPKMITATRGKAAQDKYQKKK